MSPGLPPHNLSSSELDASLSLIRRGCAEIISEAELTEKLKSGRGLVIKAGFDPTAPDLHLGHTVLLRKLRHFQDLGHKVVFLIGDATALVGDPSGQSKIRKLMTPEEVERNATTYREQVSKVLKTDDEQVFSLRRNSHWFMRGSGFSREREERIDEFAFPEMLKLLSSYTVARLIERDDFQKRLKVGQEVSMLELFYPLMQGYDSVMIHREYGACDIEIGGTDQKFNLLVGRDLQRAYAQEPQVVITMPLLEGTDGVQKMSKSLGNHIGILDTPTEMFGKVMSIPDSLIIKYFTLLTDVEPSCAINPRDAKLDLAKELVTMYHTADAASSTRQEFVSVFSERQLPQEIQVACIHPSPDGSINLVELLIQEHLAKTKNDARRLLRQGAVKLNGCVLKRPTLSLKMAQEAILRVGSRHFRKLQL